MLRRLHAEGFDIKERELMRVRAKNRWLLRVPNGMKGSPQDGPDANSTHTPMQELELEQAMLVSKTVHSQVLLEFSLPGTAAGREAGDETATLIFVRSTTEETGTTCKDASGK